LTSKTLPEGISRLEYPEDMQHCNEATLSNWLLKEGDHISADDSVCEIRTAAFSFQIPLEDGGYLAKIVVPEGMTGLSEGQTLALIADTKADLELVRDLEYKSSDVSHASHVVFDVSVWLAAINDDLLEYEDTLHKEGFDCPSALVTLTEGDLINMGVRTGHRRLLLPAIAKLNEQL
jgi:pyruvate/2-oxoglutarate dehydrogenase complex dihydrolipoamide acyltransferase (E2) component